MSVLDYERGFPNLSGLSKLGMSEWLFAKTSWRGSVASHKIGDLQHFEPVVHMFPVINQKLMIFHECNLFFIFLPEVRVGFLPCGIRNTASLNCLFIFFWIVLEIFVQHLCVGLLASVQCCRTQAVEGIARRQFCHSLQPVQSAFSRFCEPEVVKMLMFYGNWMPVIPSAEVTTVEIWALRRNELSRKKINHYLLSRIE